MTRYWWVNHNQTARQEIEGQYLWSPKTESGGARSEFYNNMRRASPGDLVVSYAAQAIRYIGRVVDFAFTAPKPEEFGGVGGNWSQEGWLLPVYWTPVAAPLSPKSILSQLRPLLPSRYSPIQSDSGNGNQKAYLAEVNQDVFDLIAAHAKFDRIRLLRGGANSLTFEIVIEILDDAVQRQIERDTALVDTERQALVAARRGQGRFRRNVERIERACRMTGVTNPALLIASHIKPWRICETGAERLDGMNGLLLTPDADHLFDRGFISFENSGGVMVSSRVDKADLRRLGFTEFATENFGMQEAPVTWKTDAFAADQCRYLDYHRREVFLS